MGNVREKAKEFLDLVPPSTVVASKGSTAALFTRLTGWTHASLQTTWKLEDIPKKKRRDAGESTRGLPTTTTCNAFVGKLSHTIKSPKYLGQFDIEQKLKKAGFGEAWVPANSGKRPGYGDVFRPIRFHMGVSLDFVGERWNTAEAGQGGPGPDYTKGYDVVKRKQQNWQPGLLQGWVDIEVLIRIALKAPKWMIGWWIFEIKQVKQYVWIPEKGSPQLFERPPLNMKQAPMTDGKKGEVSYDDDSEGITIIWPGGLVPDTLRHLRNVAYMLGSRGADQIQAYKTN